MKRILPFIVLLISIQTFSQTYTFTYGNNLRSYIVHLPSGYNASTKYPLVLNLHGYTSNASQQQLYSQMDAVADTAKFIVVYPDGVNNAWNSGTFGLNSTINDVGFISALIDTMKKKFSVNSDKVFSCGMSLGGFMSYRLACQLGNKIAAIASVTGLMSDSVRLFLCQNNCPVPVMDFHGTTDPTVNYNGAAGYASADATMAWWAAKDGCPSTPVVTNIPDINTGDGCTVTKYVYGPGQNSSEVIFFKITGGGHTWPGAFTLPSGGNTNQDIKATGEIWKFFRNHSLKCGSNPVNEVPVENNFVSVFPNPCQGRLTITVSGNSSSDPERGLVALELYNVFGEKVYSRSDLSQVISFTIDIPDLPAGVYFLRAASSNTVSFQKIVKR